MELRRERRARLNERLIGWQPAGHVHGDGGNDTPFPAIGRHEAPFSNSPLRDHDLIGDRWQTDRLKVDAKLIGPEGWERLMRTAC